MIMDFGGADLEKALPQFKREVKSKGFNFLANVMRQIAEGVAALHRLGLVHRDMKPENVVFNQHEGTAKLVDFGLSRFVQPGAKSGTGNLPYIAPDQFEIISPSSDVWSLGLLYINILRLDFDWGLWCHPKDSKSPDCWLNKPGSESPVKKKKVFEKILKKIIVNLPTGAKELIEKMLTYDHMKRITIEEVLEHPFLKKEELSEV